MAKRKDDAGLYRRGQRWWLRIYLPGQGKKHFPLVPSGERFATTQKQIARQLAAKLRRQLLSDPEAARPLSDLGALVEQFFEVNRLGAVERHARSNLAKVRAFIDAEGVDHHEDITVERVQNHLVKLGKRGRRPKTLWNHRAALSAFCTFLADRGVIESNPCTKVKTPRVEKHPPRYLSPEQCHETLRLAVEHGIFAEVLTVLQTGMRREELRRLAWRDVDFERGIVIVPKSKSRRPRQIPISSKLCATLRMQQKQTGNRQYVFPGARMARRSGMRAGRWWDEALKPIQDAMPVYTETGDKSVGRAWHIFRHTFASRLVQAGVPLAKISAWLGHASITTTMIYSHLAPGHDEDINKA